MTEQQINVVVVKACGWKYVDIGETIRKSDEVNIQPFEWEPIWEKVTYFVGWKVTERTYGKYRR